MHNRAFTVLSKNVRMIASDAKLSLGSSSSSLFHQFHSSSNNNNSSSPIGSPTRVQKLIASQSDPLLAKEIFDYASLQPNFRHNYSTYLILILKFGRSKHFSLLDDLLRRLKSQSQPITPTLFSYLIKIYGEANLPDKALNTFYTMLQFNIKPLTKHLNRILEILVSRRNYVRPAFDLFKDAHKHGVFPDTKSYNILMRAFCLNGDISIAYTLFNKMTLVNGLCHLGMLDEATKYVEEMLSKGFSPHFAVIHALVKGLCNVGRIEEACGVLTKSLEHREAPHKDTWMIIVPQICDVDDGVKIGGVLEEVLKIEIKGDTRIMDAGIGLEDYLIRKIRAKSRQF
ncbi:hypothetical protein TSUD_348140 [Trifolium subterraneum]|nr:hypothetical protein TSUD_348140 [Trifolium subterraneum]